MAWTGQSFSVGQILTAAQMTNLQTDITAAFGKEAGAPQLADDYMEHAMHSDFVTGANQVVGLAGNTTSTSYVKIKEFYCNRNGNLSTTMELWNIDLAGAVYGRIYRNGSAIGTERITSGQTQGSWSENISVSIGDLIQFYSHISTGAVSSGANVKFFTGDSGVISPQGV